MVEIRSVEPKSAAARAGLKAGDRLLSVNGHEIRDVLDYRFYIADCRLTLLLERGKKTLKRKIKKEEYADIGLSFETALMDKKQSCRNGCIFCFIDQLPKGMRESLYFKDDDARLSFLHGNYITLTNLSDEDIDRIVEMHLSPIQVSVHTTNPELRVRMMKNKRAGEVLSYLPRLAAAGITLRAQIVLCRGINDGDELERTMADLAALAPALDSVSVVPSGLTAHREGLYPLLPYDKDASSEVIDRVEAFAAAQKEKTGSRLLFAADEFYLMAGRPLPEEEDYEGYPQIENGVGMLRSFKEEALLALADAKTERQRHVSLATGVAAAPLMRELAALYEEKNKNTRITVYEIKNKTFGETITVSGLLTGRDILDALREKDLGEELLLPRNTLRSEGDLFLCGMSASELSAALSVPLRFVEEDGEALISAFTGGED